MLRLLTLTSLILTQGQSDTSPTDDNMYVWTSWSHSVSGNCPEICSTATSMEVLNECESSASTESDCKIRGHYYVTVTNAPLYFPCISEYEEYILAVISIPRLSHIRHASSSSLKIHTGGIKGDCTMYKIESASTFHNDTCHIDPSQLDGVARKLVDAKQGETRISVPREFLQPQRVAFRVDQLGCSDLGSGTVSGSIYGFYTFPSNETTTEKPTESTFYQSEEVSEHQTNADGVIPRVRPIIGTIVGAVFIGHFPSL
eukprot:Blabericola_migrator_1__1736@NODE_146_length_12961_cov_103_787110_g127_i0_p4_GENE_NODE_146_length_12961_cov_103_787110_g127_i0NODE_146_length_12961_cov_103_787110_g127_i0_p4_ORF_typecomplete_len258_score22_88_NODE_146_length_12961_cov_103_787110_g127_i064547227